MASFEDFETQPNTFARGVIRPAPAFNEFIDSLEMTESNGGINLWNARTGATGPLQVTPIAAKDIGGDYSRAVEDHAYARGLGVQYAKKLWKQFGEDPALVAAAYHTGPTTVRKLLASVPEGQDPTQWVVSQLGPEGRGHNEKVMGRFTGQLKYDSDTGRFTEANAVKIKPTFQMFEEPTVGDIPLASESPTRRNRSDYNTINTDGSVNWSETWEKTKRDAKNAGLNTLGVLNIIAGIPAFVLGSSVAAGSAGVGALGRLAGFGKSAVTGAQEPVSAITDKAIKQGEEVSELFNKYFNPVTLALNAAKSSEALDDTMANKAMNELTKAVKGYSKAMEKQYGVDAGAVEISVNQYMSMALARKGQGAGVGAEARASYDPVVNRYGNARRPGMREAEVVDAEVLPEQRRLAPPKPVTFDQFTLEGDVRVADAFIKETLEDAAKQEAAAAKAKRAALRQGTAIGAGIGAAGVAGTYLYNKFQPQGNQLIDQGTDVPAPKEGNEIAGRVVDSDEYDKLLSQFGSLAAIPFAIGAVKGKGGMWHPEAVERLSKPLALNLVGGRGLEVIPGIRATEGSPQVEWSNRAIRNYLNKHAGTATDPLKDVEIPFGDGVKRWEELTDDMIRRSPSTEYPGQYEYHTKVGGGDTSSGRTARDAVTSYLSHVGDYLRQSVDPAKLQQYDLVRAVKETAANDERVAKEMEKAAAASTKDLPVYKEYPDGMKWVELKLSEKLTDAQTKGVRKATRKELLESFHPGDMPPPAESLGDAYIALDSKGQPIRNSYTDGNAIGRTPQEAHLAGQLAQEGNQMDHCVGGYCEGVASGESRIFSLRDAKGRSHVTVEVEPKGRGYDPEKGDSAQPNANKSDNILQIKGKQNRAPVAEYLPYVQDFVKSGPVQSLEANPFIGYLAKNGKTEFFSEIDAKKADYHHSFLVKDMDRYNDDSTLRFVRNDGKNEYTLLGNAAIKPFDAGENVKQIKQLAIKLLDEGADPKAPMVIGEMYLPKIEAPYQNKKIGTLEELSGGYKLKKAQWGKVGDLGNTGLYRLDMRPGENLPPSDLAALPRPDILADAARHLQNKGSRYATREDIIEAAGPDYTRAVEKLAELKLKSTPQGPRNQQGKSDVGLMTTLAVAGLGAVVGAVASDYDKRLFGALIGAGGALGLMALGRSGIKGRTPIHSIDYGLGVISTRLRNISEPLRFRAVEYERTVLRDMHAAFDKVHPFLKALDKIPTAKLNELNRSIISNEPGVINKVIQDTKNPELIKGWQQTRSLLVELGNKWKDQGRISDLRTDYFPRIVKDVDGLLNALGKENRKGIDKALQKAELEAIKSRGTGLTQLEESIIINRVLQNWRENSGQLGPAKARRLKEVTDSLVQFYATPSEALHSYISTVVRDLQKAKFFGHELAEIKKGNVTYLDIDTSIGNVVRKELDAGRIDNKQAQELQSIIKSRFTTGEQGSTPWVQDVKNLANAGLLGNIVSAVTQFGDAAIPIYLHGFRAAFASIVRNLTGHAKVNVKDFGLIDHIAEEFANKRTSANALQWLFRYSGFSSIDRFGKNITLGSALSRYERLAHTVSGQKELAFKYQASLGEEFPQLLKDLQAKKRTDLVDSVLFSELSNVQPITRMEVPQGYLDHPNGRVLYMLKTFMIKQMDIMRRDGYNEIKKGNVAKGIGNLARYALILGIAGATTDQVKNWILGRNDPFEARDIWMNVLKTFGWSEYVLNKATQGGKPVEAVAGMAVPPYRMLDDILRLDPKAVQYIPIIGKLLYDRAFGGNQKAADAKATRDMMRLNDPETDAKIKQYRNERNDLYRLYQRGDIEKFDTGLEKLKDKYSLSAKQEKAIRDTAKLPADVRKFKSLPIDQQRVILEKSSPEQREKFRPHAKMELRN